MAELDKPASWAPSAKNTRFSQCLPADCILVVFSLSTAPPGPVIWKCLMEGKQSVHNILDLHPAGSFGRDTNPWSGLHLGGVGCIYSRTAEKYAWTPPWASDQLLCHQCLYHRDRDWCPRIRFHQIYIARESPTFQALGNWKAFSFTACWDVLLSFSRKLAALSSLWFSKLLFDGCQCTSCFWEHLIK